MLTLLDLFSGMGGFSLAFETEGFRTLAFAETDADASLILAGNFPGIPNLGDVSAIDCGAFRARHGVPLVVAGGVPCQPASLLGKRRGAADARWLWPGTIRILRELRPRYAVFENPPAILTLDGGSAFNGIAGPLAALGYDLWWDVLPAACVGAGHLRERLFLVASHAPSITQREPARESDPITNERDPRMEPFCESAPPPPPHADRAGLEGLAGDGTGEGRPQARRPTTPPDLRALALSDPLWWQAQSPVQPLAHGLPGGLVEAALRCVGNAVVPQVIRPIAAAIREHHRATLGGHLPAVTTPTGHPHP